MHSIVYTAENVLTPEVIQTIYTQRKQLNHLAVRDRTFDDFCFKVPILKFPEEGLLACNGKKKETESTMNPWAEWDSFENFDEEFDAIGTEPNSTNGVDIWNPIVSMFLPMSNVNIDMLEKWSDDFYPELYCGCIEATETACYEENIVELWAEQVSVFACYSYMHYI